MKAGYVAAAMMMAATPATAAGFNVTSPDLKNGGTVGMKHVYKGCGGENISPALKWEGAPAGTKSFAVTVYDPDAPTGSGWWHWLVFDLPATTHELAAGAGDPGSHLLPKGAIQARTDFGSPGYGGPCPPKGDKPHHYIFTVYALSVPSLKLDSDVSGAMVGFAMHKDILAKATLTATWGH